MTDLRDKIARALFLFDYGHQGADAWEASRLDGNSDRPHAYSQADAVLAVLDTVVTVEQIERAIMGRTATAGAKAVMALLRGETDDE